MHVRAAELRSFLISTLCSLKVIVDCDTVLSTLILKGDDVQHVEKFPGPIMQWSEELYRPVFSPLGQFWARENGVILSDSSDLRCHAVVNKASNAITMEY